MPQAPIKSTTQEHLDVDDIQQNLVLFKDGGAALVLHIGAVNFDLLSEEEQDGIIYSYAALLNSLTFPIQILIRSQQKDITNYLKILENQETNTANQIIRNRLNKYRQFVEKLVKERRVLDKKCYAILPFYRSDLGLTSTNPLQPKPTTLPFDKSYIIEKALANLEPKRDHLLRQFGRVGLVAKQLNTQELIELFFSIYNPHSSTGALRQKTTTNSPLVQGSQ